MNLKRKYWLMEQAQGDGGDAGGGGSADAGADAGTAGGEGDQSQGDQSQQSGDGSALKAGAGEGWKPEAVAEKYHVKKEDGSIDIEKTLQKVEDARSSLEKRMGSGDVRPKDAGEYKMPDLPTELEGVDLSGADDFKKVAHDLGLSQKQYEGVMKQYLDQLPKLVDGNLKAKASEVVSELRGVWGEDSVANFNAADRALTTISEQLGIDYSEALQAVDNNPIALRILAAVGKEMQEDKTPGDANQGGIPAGFDVEAAQASEAYQNARHPDHKKVSKQVSDYFAKNAPKE